MKKPLFLALFALLSLAAVAQPAIRNATVLRLANGDTTYSRSALDFKTWMAAGGGTVTSVGLALPGEFSISGSPVTGSGTLTGAWASQTANRVLASPNGSAGAPAFRALVAADIPTIAASQVAGANLTAGSSKVTVTGGTGASLVAASVDVVESNLTLSNLGGTLSVAKGGTGLTSVGADVTILGSNGTANVYLVPTVTTAASTIAFTRNASNLELNIPNADASNRGTVSTSAQTFAGAKTFSALLTGSAGLTANATSTQAAITATGVAGSAHTSITANTTLDHTHNFVAIGTLSAAITVTLPTCNATRDGWEYRFEKAGADSFSTTIDPSGAETFADGATTKVIYSQGNSARCKCRSSDSKWYFSTGN